MRNPDRFGSSFHFLGKGDSKSVVLRLLEDRPMHGYEIIKSLQERYHGLYTPSAGAIYPALRRLLDKGYVTLGPPAVSVRPRRPRAVRPRAGDVDRENSAGPLHGEGGRKIYHITREGKGYLRSRRREIEQRFRAFEKIVGPERAGVFREFGATGRLLRANIRDVTPAQAGELKRLFIEMRERALRILSK